MDPATPGSMLQNRTVTPCVKFCEIIENQLERFCEKYCSDSDPKYAGWFDMKVKGLKNHSLTYWAENSTLLRHFWPLVTSDDYDKYSYFEVVILNFNFLMLC